MSNDVEHLFICFLFFFHLYIFSEISKSYAYFLLNFWCSLCILKASPLLCMWYGNIFSKCVSYIFILLIVFFTKQKFLVLMTTNLSLLKKWIIILVMYLKTLCVTQGHKDFFSCVFFKSVTVFWFTFRSMIHIELIFALKCEI